VAGDSTASFSPASSISGNGALASSSTVGPT
jgi:hypothetical protein